MKKNKKTYLTPEQALQYLEGIRTLYSEIDEPIVHINFKVPKNILRLVKLKAKADGKTFQSLMIDYLRKGLREKY